LSESGLKQADVVISFTGVNNTVAPISDLKEFDPVQASIEMEHAVRLASLGSFSKISFPEGMPSIFKWEWDSTKARSQGSSIPEDKRKKAFRFDAFGKYEGGAYLPFGGSTSRIVLKASQDEAKVLGSHLQVLSERVTRHFDFELENTLAYIRFVPYGDTMLVYNIQTGLFSIKLPARLRARYNYWQRHTMLAVEDYAFKAGFGQIYYTPASYHLGRWSMEGGVGIHPRTAFRIYSLEPYKMGYSLTETPPYEVDWHEESLFWHKKRPDFFHVSV